MKPSIFLLVLMFVVGVAGTEAQRGGGGGGRMGGGMGPGGGMRENPEMMEKMWTRMEALRAFPVGDLWAVLSLSMDLPQDKLNGLRMVFGDAWKKHQECLLLAQEHGSWKEVKEELRDLKKTVDGQVEAMLDKDQQKVLRDQLKKNESLNRSMRM